jgi:hypothetical protein
MGRSLQRKMERQKKRQGGKKDSTYGRKMQALSQQADNPPPEKPVPIRPAVAKDGWELAQVNPRHKLQYIYAFLFIQWEGGKLEKVFVPNGVLETCWDIVAGSWVEVMVDRSLPDRPRATAMRNAPSAAAAAA